MRQECLIAGICLDLNPHIRLSMIQIHTMKETFDRKHLLTPPHQTIMYMQVVQQIKKLLDDVDLPVVSKPVQKHLFYHFSDLVYFAVTRDHPLNFLYFPELSRRKFLRCDVGIPKNESR